MRKRKGDSAVYAMSISYNKLWKLLIDKKIGHTEFRRTVEISYSTLTKLRRDEAVSMDVLMKVCGLLDCNVGDILDFIKTEITEPEPAVPAPEPKKRRVKQ